jgi:hypothetical protein
MKYIKFVQDIDNIYQYNDANTIDISILGSFLMSDIAKFTKLFIFSFF